MENKEKEYLKLTIGNAQETEGIIYTLKENTFDVTFLNFYTREGEGPVVVVYFKDEQKLKRYKICFPFISFINFSLYVDKRYIGEGTLHNIDGTAFQDDCLLINLNKLSQTQIEEFAKIVVNHIIVTNDEWKE